MIIMIFDYFLIFNYDNACISIKDQISSCIKFYIRNHSCDEFQKDEQGEVWLNLVSRLYHWVWHGLEHSCVATWVHCRHWNAFQIWKDLYSQSFIEIFSLNIISNLIVADRFSVFVVCAEEHPWSMIELIINDIHFIVSIVLNDIFFLLYLCAFKDYDFVLPLVHDLALNSLVRWYL